MLDLLIIGAGPCGLAVGIAARRAGLRYLVVEKGDVVASFDRYPTHMTFFSTPEKLAIGDHLFTSRGFRPDRVEAVRYYRGVAAAEQLNIRTGCIATGVERHVDGFVAHLQSGADAVETLTARHLVVATGYLHNPRLLNVPGEDLPTVSHWYTEGSPFPGQHVVVIGGKNSAVDAAIDLVKHGARVTLVHRRAALSESVKPWVLPEFQTLVDGGQVTLQMETTVQCCWPDRVQVESHGRRWAIPCNYIFALTGYHPDHSLLTALGVTIDAATGIPAHNPETMETNVPGLYLAGVIAAGYDANKIFIENGRFHGEQIVAHIQSTHPTGG